MKSMLLNLSNHPSKNWSEGQLSAAVALYGEVRDMQFPNVPPEMDDQGIMELAMRYLGEIKGYPDPVSHVHLMGEMSFTVALVGLLQRAGIEVLCSTSERVVLEEVDGRKTMQFRFVRFRKYVF